MDATERSMWQRLRSGQEEAARVAAQVRRPVEAGASFRRVVTLRQIAARHARADLETRTEENMRFHLRWRELRTRLRP
jgi:hypothetical protein